VTPIGNRTRDLPARSATTPPRAPCTASLTPNKIHVSSKRWWILFSHFCKTLHLYVSLHSLAIWLISGRS